jgi:hypothetical protein
LADKEDIYTWYGNNTLMAKSKAKTIFREPDQGDQTRLQVEGTMGIFWLGTTYLPNPAKASYKLYREISHQPTVAYIRQAIISQIMTTGHSVTGTGPAADLINRTFNPLIAQLKEAMAQDLVDYGWSGFEKVFASTDDGQIILRKYKNLLPDLTNILIDPANGDLVGLRQVYIVIPVEKVTHACLLPRGTQWYGNGPLLENVRGTYHDWMQANDSAARYDKKICGELLTLHYKAGSSIDSRTGLPVDNSVLAEEILRKMESSGSIALPDNPDDNASGTEYGLTFRVERNESSQQQHSFVDRLAYLDKMFCRGLGFGERSLIEASMSGSRADSETHTDIGLNFIEYMISYIYSVINKDVDQIIALNFGDGAIGTVKVVPDAIIDEQRSYLKGIFKDLINKSEVPIADSIAIADMIGVPRAGDVDDAAGQAASAPIVTEEPKIDEAMITAMGTNRAMSGLPPATNTEVVTPQAVTG